MDSGSRFVTGIKRQKEGRGGEERREVTAIDYPLPRIVVFCRNSE